MSERANPNLNISEDIIIGKMCKQMDLPMPTYEDACSFSIEMVMNNDPIGIHNPHFNEDQIKHLLTVS